MANHGCLHFRVILLPNSRSTNQLASTLIPNSKFLEIESDWPSILRWPKSYNQGDRVVQHQKGTRTKAPGLPKAFLVIPACLPTFFSLWVLQTFLEQLLHKVQKGRKTLKLFQAEETAEHEAAQCAEWTSQVDISWASIGEWEGPGNEIRNKWFGDSVRNLGLYLVHICLSAPPPGLLAIEGF